jgi:PGF-pre-PGF domain-containing protein
MVKKRELFILFCSTIVLCLVAYLVLAAPTMNSPKSNYNFSTTINFSCTTGLANTLNASLLYNASGGPATIILVTVINTSADQSVFENSSVDVTSLSDGASYNMTCLTTNLTNTQEYSTAASSITIDDTPPNVSSIVAPTSGANLTVTNLTINASVSDTTIGMGSVYFNVTNSSGVQKAFIKASNVTGAYYNATLDLNASSYPDGKYNITVYANDTQLNNLNNTEKIQITVDNTAPTITFTCTPATVSEGESVTCSCGGTDATSGVNTSSLSYTPSPSTSLTGTFTLTCTGEDYSGNSGNDTASYTVEPLYTSSGTGTTTTPSKQKAQSWIKVTPGAATIMKNFDPEYGIKQISVQVNNTAQNVRVTVTKYDGKPAQVTKEKEGKVYSYLRIKTQNLENKLSKGIISLKISKSWLSNNSIEKDNIALYKFDEDDEEWEELETTYKEEDTDNYYYDVELTNFSYFAIAETEAKPEEAVTPEEEPEVTVEEELEEKAEWGGVWLWIAVIVIIIAVVAYIIYNKKFKEIKKQ